MEQFISRVTLFLLPIIVGVVVLEIAIRQIPNDYSFKRNFLDAKAKDVEVLFLGSSHTYYGINPKYIEANAFNAAHISQSIDYDYAILEKYRDNWAQLKHIAIPIDYLTFSYKVENGIEPWRVKNYNIYYDLDYKWYKLENYEMLNMKLPTNFKRFFSHYIKGAPSITCSAYGFGIEKGAQLDLEKTGEAAAKRHTATDSTNIASNIQTIKDIVAFGKEKNVKILFYTSPAYHTYVSNLDEEQLDMTFKTIGNIVAQAPHCQYHNFLENDIFLAEDYSDADHLNAKGAKKLSMILNEIMIGVEKEDL